VGQQNICKALLQAAQSETFEAIWERWRGYTRHYPASASVEEGVTVHCGASAIPHGFRYWHRPILVMTELTHEAYKRSIAALPSGVVQAVGPAGTGKTETQKDLAQVVLGYSCVVINCSDSLDEQAVIAELAIAMQALPQHYFVFDEFNRIPIDSANTLLNSIVACGSTRLVNTAITYNPGYKARHALPEAAERIPMIEMLPPSHAAIVEVMLATEGFQHYASLGQPFAAFIADCRESLTKQPHYDFGLRAVKAVILSAGRIRRSAGLHGSEQEEAAVLARALQSTVMPALTFDDARLAEARLQDCFIGCNADSASLLLQEHAGREAQVVKQVVQEEAMQLKVLQLIDCCTSRHGVAALSKDRHKVVSCLSLVAPLLDRQLVYIGYTQGTSLNNPRQEPVETLMDELQLYGGWKEGGEWQDGSFTAALRMLASRADAVPTWLVLDGPMDAMLMERLNTVLDDNKELRLESGEMIKVPENLTILFVVDESSTAVMSPANISRLGWVNFDMSAPSSSWWW